MADILLGIYLLCQAQPMGCTLMYATPPAVVVCSETAMHVHEYQRLYNPDGSTSLVVYISPCKTV